MSITAMWFCSSTPTGRYRSQLWSTPATVYGFRLRNQMYIIDLLYDCDPWLSSEWHANRPSDVWGKTSLVEQEDLFYNNWSMFQWYHRTTTVRHLMVYGHTPSEWDYFLMLMYAYQFGIQLTPSDMYIFNKERRLRLLNLDFSPMDFNKFIWRSNLIWSAPHRCETVPVVNSNDITETILVHQFNQQVASVNSIQPKSITTESNIGTDDQFTDYLSEEIDLDYLRQKLKLEVERVQVDTQHN